ncbi:MAG: hypothetical protein M3347_09785 [Armatimonadota bacterium]|nr:hypothetical protein [Armatimonadota bacterium]
MAITLDYGKCEQCGENNVKTATICRSCQTRLPWAKPLKQTASGEAATSSIPDWVAPVAGGLVVLALLVVGIRYLTTVSFDSSNLAGIGAIGAVMARVMFRRWLWSAILGRDD